MTSTRDSSQQLERELKAAEELLATEKINAPSSPLYQTQLLSRIERLKEQTLAAETDEFARKLKIELSAALQERDNLTEKTAKIAELEKVISGLRSRKMDAEQQEQREQRQAITSTVTAAKSEWLHAIRQAARAYRQLLDAQKRAGQLGVQTPVDPHLLRFDGPLIGRSWQGTLGEAMQTGKMPFEQDAVNHFEDTVEEKAA